MKQSLLVLFLASFFLAACGGPSQALPEQERENFERILQEEANKNK